MNISERLRAKLAALPDRPGVYLMRDRAGKVIYVGKASSLRNRVRSYFRHSGFRAGTQKHRALICAIHDLDLMPLRSEAEALLIEGQLIKEYRPRFNVEFKDDKRFLLLRIAPSDPFPRFTTCRIKKDDGAVYFGPYAETAPARAAMEYVERAFGLRRCRPRVPGPEDHRHCLDEIIRHCSAPCVGRISAEDYAVRVQEAIAFLRGRRPERLKALREEMRDASARQDFERAAALRDTLRMVDDARRRTLRELKSPLIRQAESEQGQEELQTALGLPTRPRVIECYDISNIQGTLAVGSMVCAVDGYPRRNRYRRFRIQTVTRSDDPAMMHEVLLRRFRRVDKPGWEPPDLVLVDGGLTQLRAARAALAEAGCAEIPTAGLAKRFEELIAGPPDQEHTLRLPLDSPGLVILRRIRDEAHRFALTYHRYLRARRIRESLLDEIPGVGEQRKQVLLTHFGSLLRLRRASVEEIAAVPGVGAALAGAIHATLNRSPSSHAHPN
ncbi:MAG: excinuclease ABC subunit UvrC [Kiritimatiellae bacterium]|nr:excinuclease ABC subunit UvrC [Kiritimatiellia bacterium]